MKKTRLTFIVLLTLIFSIQAQNRTDFTLALHGNWQFCESGTGKWLDARVPGTVHSDLIRHNLIPDPFFGTNEKQIQWVENRDWEYRTTFQLSEDDLKHNGAEIIFEGLDTYADVYLNGSLILKADNMFRGYQADVKKLLRKGENRMHILFHSPITSLLPQWESSGINYPADNDHHEKKLSIFSRKAPYSYGWDWGIRMVTSGVWRPVALHFYNIAKIEDVHICQMSLSDIKANVNHTTEISALSTDSVQLTVDYLLNGKSVLTKTKNALLTAGRNKLTVNLTIEKPELWMPHGWGKPVLYTVKTTLSKGNSVLSEKLQRYGFRTIRLVNEKDEYGESFYFEVNGMPMYAKGANYIPQDAMLPNVTEARYRELFSNILAANMNMVRVWGGGTYESDLFYDLADENGILVWQDFMFGCTTYPHDDTFLNRVREETEYNIKRLRNHACLALWCGNNEILEGMHQWGWSKRYPAWVYSEMFRGYDLLFRELLPSQVDKFDLGRSYIHGSPLSSTWGKPDSWAFGDSHNWGVWYGRKKFESFDTETGRFMSEFGFQSFPEMKTIARFANPADYQLESEVMNAHQKSSIGNSLIRSYMERDYVVPEKFEDFVYVGLVLQGQGMRYGFEAQRRNKPYCMGTLYWQLNDSWPVVSWSGIDYFGNWKALHYQAKRAFEPLLVSPVQRNDSLVVYLVSDLITNSPDLTLKAEVTDFSGKIIRRFQKKTNIEANVSKVIWKEKVSELLSDAERKSTFVKLSLTNNKGKLINQQIYFVNKTKDLLLPEPKIDYTVKYKDGLCELTLRSNKLVKDLFVEFPVHGARFSDNFFDLLPGENKKIIISSPQILKNRTYNFEIQHIQKTIIGK